MTNVVAITQRVVVDPIHFERRDALDQAWCGFLSACGLVPMPLPNDVAAALALCESMPIRGVLLSGGNDLCELGGDSPERDRTEHALLDRAAQRHWPVLGVCRGMQMLQHRCGIVLERIEGHVARSQTILIHGREVEVNSYHHWGARASRWPLVPFALGTDGIVKGVRDAGWRTIGVMWHPERDGPARERDVTMCRDLFLGDPS